MCIRDRSNLKTDQAIARLRYIMDAKLSEATIKKLASECNLNYIQAKKIVDLLPHEIANVQADTNTKNASASASRASATVALDSLSTAAVTRSLLSSQNFELDLKNQWNAEYMQSVRNEFDFIRTILIRANGYLK